MNIFDAHEFAKKDRWIREREFDARQGTYRRGVQEHVKFLRASKIAFPGTLRYKVGQFALRIGHMLLGHSALEMINRMLTNGMPMREPTEFSVQVGRRVGGKLVYETYKGSEPKVRGGRPNCFDFNAPVCSTVEFVSTPEHNADLQDKEKQNG